jgi:hypothetical protein
MENFFHDIICNEITRNLLTLGIPVLTLFVTCLALRAAKRIPEQIMTDQRFMALTEQYRSPEMGFAIYSIFRFYAENCQSNPDKITGEYTQRFKDEIKMPLAEGKGIDPSKTLQFQRRLVAYYFWDLSRLYFESPRLDKKRLLQMVGENERNLISLVLQMSEANKKCFAGYGTVIEPPDDDVPMNQSIRRLYEKTGKLI